MDNVDILLAVFACFLSWILYMTVLRPYIEKVFKARSKGFLVSYILAQLSFDSWKFFEELDEALVPPYSIEVTRALDRLLADLGHIRKVREVFLLEVLDILLTNELIEIRTEIYSRENVAKNPQIFASLPEWKREECEDFLLRLEHGSVSLCLSEMDMRGKPVRVFAEVKSEDAECLAGRSLVLVRKKKGGKHYRGKDGEFASRLQTASAH